MSFSCSVRINPAQLAAYRKALYPSGAKSDPCDAELMARFVREHGDQVRIWRPDDEISRGLRMLSEQRREWVEQRVGLENHLRQRLKETYPLALQLFPGDLHAENCLAFLAKFPTLRKCSGPRRSNWPSGFPSIAAAADDPPAEELRRQQVQAIRQAMPLTKDRAVIEHARLVICHVVAQIQSLSRAIAECDQRIAALFAQHPDREVFTSFPGAGSALAPRLAAAFGTDREKFQPPRTSSRSAASRRSPAAAARRRSCRSVGHVPSSCGKLFTSSLAAPRGSRPGHGPTWRCVGPPAPPTRSSSGLWPSNGNASSSVAGKTASPTTNNDTCKGSAPPAQTLSASSPPRRESLDKSTQISGLSS